MSDWQVGDLAVCVDSRDNPYLGKPKVRQGAVYAVAGIDGGMDPFTMQFDVGLQLRGFGTEAFASSRFRKIRPDEHESCEPEFVTLLKRSRKTVRA